MTTETAFIAVCVLVFCNLLLRYVPFLVFGNKRKTPEIVSYLGNVLPYAIIGLLIIYCIKSINFHSPSGFLPPLIACAVTAGLHVAFKKTLLSIVVGTVCYMMLIQYVFV